MTVEELIEKLQELDPCATVTICDLKKHRDGSMHFESIETIEQIKTSTQLFVAIYFES